MSRRRPDISTEDRFVPVRQLHPDEIRFAHYFGIPAKPDPDAPNMIAKVAAERGEAIIASEPALAPPAASAWSAAFDRIAAEKDPSPAEVDAGWADVMAARNRLCR